MNETVEIRTPHLHGTDKRLAIVIGFGPVGRSVHRLLRDAGMRTVVVDFNLDTVAELKASGQQAIYGDASHEGILTQAGAATATHVIVTLPGASDRAAIVAAVRGLNAKARVLVRARYLRERSDLERSGATAAVFEEAEAAVALARLVLVDAGVSRSDVDQKVHDLRLQLLMENMAGLRTQRVRSVMVPWSHVRRLSVDASRDNVLSIVSEARYSRWPVVDPGNDTVTGYLLAKDLIAGATNDHWQRLVRALGVVRPDDFIEQVLLRMQGEAASLYLVQGSKQPLGIITIEDILEQVFGQIEDEYRHEVEVTLAAAASAINVAIDLGGTAPEPVIRELVAALPAGRLPKSFNHADVIDIVVAREQAISTDLGVGVAVPHGRLPGLSEPLLLCGRSRDGVVFSPDSPSVVRLVFLLLTPHEQPETQISLLQQVALLAQDRATCNALLTVPLASQMGDVLRDRAPSGGAQL